jgi:hypothetical protein
VAGVLFDKSQTTLIEYPAGKAGPYMISNSVTSIGDVAFGTCASLTSVTFPDTVTSIGSYAFEECVSLTSATLSSNVASIGTAPFDVCTALTTITVDPLNPFYCSLNGVLFDKSMTVLIQYPAGRVGNYSVPNSVASIEHSAFWGCGGMTNVMIPSSVINIDDYAFASCAHLTGVYFNGNAPSVGANSFGYPATVYYLPRTSGWSAGFGGVPAFLWNPQVQTSGSSFGVRTSRCGFNITGTTNIPIVVEACTNMTSASWIALQNCMLTNGSIYFSDPQWTSYHCRFYRIRSP